MFARALRRFFTLQLLLLASIQAFAALVPIYKEPSTADYRQAAEAFRSAQFLERVASAINAIVRIPVQMPLTLGECGAVNAYYDPRHRSIHMCYELMEQVITGIDRDFGQGSKEQKMEAAMGALIFILLHEVGHGLADVLRLPILGKEEDAVDAIATYILLSGRNPMPGVVGTLWFFSTTHRQPSLRDFADEHSLGQQRVFSLICMAVGSDQEKFRPLAMQFSLPDERAVRCPDQYAQLRRSVQSLLGKYFAPK